MKNLFINIIIITTILIPLQGQDFVPITKLEPSILQDMRYATFHNFVGKPINGYRHSQCILAKAAAIQLQKVQSHALQLGYTLKVWDCYRPQKAVEHFYDWSQDSLDQTMKQEFYLNEDKKTLFERGFIGRQSGHSRGSTVDLTLVKLPAKEQPEYKPGEPLKPCFASDRFPDNSIDMGSGFDCFDQVAWTNYQDITQEQRDNRDLLVNLMLEAGFKNYEQEWWHYTLINEPYPNQYFDFDV